MKISDHSVSFRSTHQSSVSYQRKERLEFWTGSNPHRNSEAQSAQTRTPDTSQLIKPDKVKTDVEDVSEASSTENGEGTDSSREELELKILISSINMFLSSNKLKFRDPSSDQIREAYSEGKDKIEQIQSAPDEAQTTSNDSEANFGLRYDMEERYEEKEKLTFETTGKIKTADGESIDFSVDLSMSRQFVVKNEEHLRAGNAQPIDPLVINYDGKAADLSDKNFNFDLDLDGTTEKLSRLKPGNGFLALDKNGNGKIDDGAELFGPSTGHGFKELAQYDQDGNRFIDEGDDVYDKLYVMRPGPDGKQSMQSLDDVGAGAIFLGSSDTSFSFKNRAQLQGQLKRSGVYIKENGEAGIVQEIDMVPQSEQRTTGPPSSEPRFSTRV